MPNGYSDDRAQAAPGRGDTTLQPVPGIDLDEYKKTLIERFSNPKIRDRLPRLYLNGAAKIPKFF